MGCCMSKGTKQETHKSEDRHQHSGHDHAHKQVRLSQQGKTRVDQVHNKQGGGNSSDTRRKGQAQTQQSRGPDQFNNIQGTEDPRGMGREGQEHTQQPRRPEQFNNIQGAEDPRGMRREGSMQTQQPRGQHKANDSSERQLEKENKELKQSKSKKKYKIDSLKKENEDLRARLQQVTNVEKQVQAECRQLHERLKQVEKYAEQQLNEERYKFSKSIRSANARIATLEKENADLTLRLSAFVSAKMTDGNPDIADLSDENRPTKIADMYSELYDNEWTDAFSHLVTKYPDQKAIEILLQILMISYRFCSEKAEGYWTSLMTSMEPFRVGEQLPLPVTITRELKDNLKKNYKQGQKSVKGPVLTQLKKTQMKVHLDHQTLETFVDRVIEITWLMAIQDPQLALDEDAMNRKGHRFDKDMYREYTVRGEKVEFVVWPSLHITKNGALLGKGTAQGLKAQGTDDLSDTVRETQHETPVDKKENNMNEQTKEKEKPNQQQYPQDAKDGQQKAKDKSLSPEDNKNDYQNVPPKRNRDDREGSMSIPKSDKQVHKGTSGQTVAETRKVEANTTRTLKEDDKTANSSGEKVKTNADQSSANSVKKETQQQISQNQPGKRTFDESQKRSAMQSRNATQTYQTANQPTNHSQRYSIQPTANTIQAGPSNVSEKKSVSIYVGKRNNDSVQPAVSREQTSHYKFGTGGTTEDNSLPVEYRKKTTDSKRYSTQPAAYATQERPSNVSEKGSVSVYVRQQNNDSMPPAMSGEQISNYKHGAGGTTEDDKVSVKDRKKMFDKQPSTHV